MRILTVALALVAIAGMAQADILIDFGEPEFVNGMPNATYYPTPSPDSFQGRYWNMAYCDPTEDPNGIEQRGYNPVTISNLVDSTGAATSANVTLKYFITDGSMGMPSEVVYPQSAQADGIGRPWIDPNDPDAKGPNPGSIVVSGLTEPEYTLRVFSSAYTDKSYYNDGNRRTLVTVNGDSRMIHSYANEDYIESFYNIAPVGGSISLEVTGATPGGGETYSYGYIQVLELVVPEPATLSLLAIGGLVAIRRRR